jgi:ribonuclease HI
MRAPTCIKDVQKLTGCMAALNRFILKLGERGLPCFKLLKHQEKFVWTLEADQALAQLKDFLSKPPVLTAPRKKEQLLLYLAATTHVVSSAIVVERQEDGHAYPVQRPVYFVSEVLSESKARYQPVQKLLYAVLITSRKLRHYFYKYSIFAITDYPLGDILRNQDATGRISKWAVELGALNIDFKPRTAIKSQALVDFMAEWPENQLPSPAERPKHWVMYFDDSLKLEGAGAGVLLISPMGEQLKYVLQIFSKVSNNKAEYEALLHGLRLAASLGIKRLLVYDDSAVIINLSQQVLGPQQGEHGRLLSRSLQAREQVLRSRVLPCRPRQQRCSGRPIEAWFYSRSSASGCLRPRASRAIHTRAGAYDH